MPAAPLRSALAALAVAGLAATGLTIGGPVSPAHADTSAVTGDESVATPTTWISQSGRTTSQITSALGSTYRLVDLHQSSTGQYTFTAVQNVGVYHVPGWWWYTNISTSQVTANLTANNARLISAEKNDNGTMNVIMVANTGTSARSWWWAHGRTAAQVSASISTNNARLVSLDQEPSGTYTTVMVANTGADAKSWWYYLNRTPAEISSSLTTNGARLVDLDAVPGQPGRFNAVMVKATGTDNAVWRWYHGMSLSTIVATANRAGFRVIDAQPYPSGSSTLWAGVMIDNLTAESRRVQDLMETGLSQSGLTGGTYGFYVKRVNGLVYKAHRNGTTYEPASTIKALYNLYAERQVQLGNDALDRTFSYWYHPSEPTNKDVCPLDYSRTSANLTQTTLADGLNRMMGVSDNRTTQGVDFRYGRASINAYATSIGMSNTVINQTLGCGFRDGGFVRLTLDDITRMFEGVKSNTLLNSTRSASFFNRMNGGTMPSSGTFATMVQQEATALGKPGVASAFTAAVTWRTKGGSYDVCPPSGSCSPPHQWYRSNAGVLTLPVKSSTGAVLPIDYAFGWWINELQLPCAFGTSCTARTQANSVISRLDSELFREQVRTALATW